MRGAVHGGRLGSVTQGITATCNVLTYFTTRFDLSAFSSLRHLADHVRLHHREPNYNATVSFVSIQAGLQ